MVLCVGSFFGSAGDADDAVVWRELLEGKRKVPVPVYLLGPNSQVGQKKRLSVAQF